MPRYLVHLSNGKSIPVDAGSWMQAGIRASKEHGGKVRDIDPIGDVPDIVVVKESNLCATSNSTSH